MTNTIEGLFKQYRPHFEQYLDACLKTKTRSFTEQPLCTLAKATQYSTLNGGKRVRPMLVYMTAACLTAHNQTIQPQHQNHPQHKPNEALIDAAAAAIEMIHCYSLIHDDLPAMDDDDLRRGKPTCHIAFGEASAILAGDALQALAFELLANPSLNASSQQLLMLHALTNAAGIAGMVGGQAIDLAAAGKNINHTQLVQMHQLKTGALITCAVELACHACHASNNQIQTLKTYADTMGLAFQVKDDILDIEGSAAEMGKTQGADIAANKSTFPSLIGLKAASEQAIQLRDQAITALAPFGRHAEPLRQLANFFIQRKA